MGAARGEGRGLMLDAIADRYVAMPSGLLLPKKHAVAELKRARRPRGVDLFAGAGGFSLGMIQAGWEVVGAVENDPLCIMTYMTNLCRWGHVQLHFVEDADRKPLEAELAKTYRKQGLRVGADGEVKIDGKASFGKVSIAGSGWISSQPASVPGVSHIIIGDCAKLTGAQLLKFIGMEEGELDAIVGGPPCQGFSVSGKRDVMDPRNSLVFDFIRLVLETQPKTMVLENVPGIQTMMTEDGIPVVDAICRALADGGFGTLDTLRRSMAGQGAMTLLRGRDKAKAEKKDVPQPAPAPAVDQLSLFDEAAD